ncbi:hypothetical protein MRX96_010840 [Rhipicephalus microplus]
MARNPNYPKKVGAHLFMTNACTVENVTAEARLEPTSTRFTDAIQVARAIAYCSTRTTTNRSTSLAARRAAVAVSQPSKRNLKKRMDSGTLLSKYHGLAVHEVYKPCKKHQMPTRRQVS